MHHAIEYDVIVIDNHGPFRWRCAEVAVSKLARGGMIILDNSDQCLKACEVMRSNGLTQIDFAGICPVQWLCSDNKHIFSRHVEISTSTEISAASQSSPA